MIASPHKKNMRTALFQNWTEETFTGWWDGKSRKFPPGKSEWMPDYLAKHFAKHLANRELLRTGADGKLIHENGEKYTSPKFPEQVPKFMELFSKAYQEEESETIEEPKNDLDTLINIANKNRQKVGAQNSDIASKVTGSNEPQVIPVPDEEEFN